MAVLEMHSTVPLQPVATVSDDSIDVLAARLESAGDLASLAQSHWPELLQAKYAIVDVDALRLGVEDVAALSKLATWGVRVVIAGRTIPGGFAPMTVLRESSFVKAAVAAIYGLDAGSSAVLLSGSDADSGTIRSIARAASDWRATWQDAEAGDLSTEPTRDLYMGV